MFGVQAVVGFFDALIFFSPQNERKAFLGIKKAARLGSLVSF
jgi:hypothetical protein